MGLIIYFLTLSRGPDSEGEWREHHREDLLSSHSLDPEQVGTANGKYLDWMRPSPYVPGTVFVYLLLFTLKNTQTCTKALKYIYLE